MLLVSTSLYGVRFMVCRFVLFLFIENRYRILFPLFFVLTKR